MRNFPVPEFADLPPDLRERIRAETERAGFTPNVFAAYAHRPKHFRGFFGYYDALLESAELSRAEIEMVVVAVSGANDCYYCAVAHGALCRIYAEAPKLADQLLTNHRTADVTDAQRTMLDVAVKLTERPAEVTRDDVERLYEVGYSETEAWDVAAVTALFNLSNRMATFADMRPNDEFFEMGRE
jgi:uncharacterized peroxidase-related enzyme